MRTAIWRRFSRRAMTLWPLTTSNFAIWERGTRAPDRVGTNMLAMAPASARASGAKRTEDVEPTLPFEQATDDAATDGQFDQILDIAHAHTETSHLLTIELNGGGWGCSASCSTAASAAPGMERTTWSVS